MAIPSSVDELFAEVTGQTATGATSARDSLRRCLEGSADTNGAYLAVWDALQWAGLLATFDFQNAVIEASQTVLGFRSHPPAPRQPARAAFPRQPAMVRLAAVSPPEDETPVRPARRADLDLVNVEEAVSSALDFPTPLGMITPEYEPTAEEDRE